MIVLNIFLDRSESPPPQNKSVFQRVLQLNYSQPNRSRKLSKDAINKPAWKNTFGSGGEKKNCGVGLESLMDFSSTTRPVSAEDVIVKVCEKKYTNN